MWLYPLSLMISICKWGQKGIWILFQAWLFLVLTGDGWRECWPCGLAFKAVLRSRHLSWLPCVDVTALSGLEVLHYDPCFSLALVLQQFLRYRRVQGCLSEQCSENFFFHSGKFSLCFLSSIKSVPHENGMICIFIEPLHLMPISLDLVTVISGQLQGKSATRLNDMQI